MGTTLFSFYIMNNNPSPHHSTVTDFARFLG
jgi:hypothetical protein